MKFIELLILALAVSMDAFAVSICLGLKMQKATFKKALIVGLYFGIFQAAMPIIGYYIAKLFADSIQAFDHWIAFVLLLILGIKMIIESFKKQGCADRLCPEIMCTDRKCPGKPETAEFSLKPKKMLPYAIATSIDALAVGVSLAFLKANIFSAIALIGGITLALCMVGVKIGNVFGSKFKNKAEIIGGVILIMIGVKILLEHLGVIAF